MLRKRHIKPSQVGNRPGYRVSFRHPLKKNKTVTAWLGTRDPIEGEANCRDLEDLCVCQDLWVEPDPLEQLTYHKRAIEIFFGAESAAKAKSWFQAMTEEPEYLELHSYLKNSLGEKEYIQLSKFRWGTLETWLPEKDRPTIIGHFYSILYNGINNRQVALSFQKNNPLPAVSSIETQQIRQKFHF